MAPRTGTSRDRLRPSMNGEIRSNRIAGTTPVVVGRSSTVTARFDGPVTAAAPDEHGRQLDCRRPCLPVVRASAAMDRGLSPYPSIDDSVATAAPHRYCPRTGTG